MIFKTVSGHPTVRHPDRPGSCLKPTPPKAAGGGSKRRLANSIPKRPSRSPFWR